MPEFRVTWQQCPHNQHPPRVVFIEGPNAEAARAIAKDHIERTYGVSWFSIFEAAEYVRPSEGRVIAS